MTTRADSIAFYHSGKLDETGGRKRVCDGSPESMHGAAGAPPQLTDGACVAAQSTDVAALRHTLQARPLALRLHRERAIGAKSTDLCAVDFHVGRAQRADNRGSRMLSRTRAHRASGGPGGGRPSSPPERPWPGSGIKGGCFSVRPRSYGHLSTVRWVKRNRPPPLRSLSGFFVGVRVVGRLAGVVLRPEGWRGTIRL